MATSNLIVKSPDDLQTISSPKNSDIEKAPSTSPEIENVSKTKASAFKSLGWLDRFLALWIFLAMAIGIILGNFVPGTGDALQKGKFVGVSVPIGWFSSSLLLLLNDGRCDEIRFEGIVLMRSWNIAVGLLVMMYPILCKVKYETLHHVFRERAIWVQLGFSIIVNWIIAPLLMVYSPLPL